MMPYIASTASRGADEGGWNKIVPYHLGKVTARVSTVTVTGRGRHHNL